MRTVLKLLETTRIRGVSLIYGKIEFPLADRMESLPRVSNANLILEGMSLTTIERRV